MPCPQVSIIMLGTFSSMQISRGQSLLLIGAPVSCLVFLYLSICLPQSARPSAL